VEMVPVISINFDRGGLRGRTVMQKRIQLGDRRVPASAETRYPDSRVIVRRS
jgi:hypothetical protein